MTDSIAALPMYDWPEVRDAVDAEWAAIRARLSAAGVDAPARLARRNGDMPAVPGGIRDAKGTVVAPDPATLPPDDLDLPTLWRHPRLLFGQTCWGPLETTGLADLVRVVGQPSYEGYEGGAGTHYSSAVVMRGEEAVPARAPADGGARLPIDLLRGRRLAFNEPHSMSGLIALTRDLAAAGAGLEVFAARHATGGHRLSIAAVAEGRADVAAIDCRSWHMARLHEPAAARLVAVGWTARRPGLPYITTAASPLSRLSPLSLEPS